MRGNSDTLAVVTTGSSNNTTYFRISLDELIEIDQATTYLKGSDRRVIFVFDPNFRTYKLAKLWPADLRGGRHYFVDYPCGGLEGGKRRLSHDC